MGGAGNLKLAGHGVATCRARVKQNEGRRLSQNSGLRDLLLEGDLD